MSKNHLSHEASLYLRQHSHQPVNWYPWGEEAFALSKKDNKPIFLSIGYASCHWCHVMAHESFEDQKTAEILNKDFVSIKVDREEFPEIDHIYMEAVQVMANHAGWPLSVFLTPELKPFFGGTYFPKHSRKGQVSFCDVLSAVKSFYNDKQAEIKEQTLEITKILSSRDANETVPDEIKNTIEENKLESYRVLLKAVNAQRGTCLELLEKEFDNDYFGFGTAPKFLQPPKLYLFLMSKDKRLNEFSKKTLRAVQSGGITDLIEGGLSRYSVDRRWCVPHFEKMLYDNALALELYSLQAFEGFCIESSSKDFKGMVFNISDFLDSELKDSKTNLYFSGLDADTEGIEGLYYTYSYNEILDILKGFKESSRRAIICYFGIEEKGQLDGRNVIHFQESFEKVTEEFKLKKEDFEGELKAFVLSLKELRKTRKKPSVDNKIILSSNALLSLSFLKSAVFLNSQELLKKGLAMNKSLVTLFKTESSYAHIYICGKRKNTAYLDDLAFLSHSLVWELYLTGSRETLSHLSHLYTYIHKNYVNENSLYYSQMRDDLIYRPQKPEDNVIPSANAILIESIDMFEKWLKAKALFLENKELTESCLKIKIASVLGTQQLLKAYPSACVRMIQSAYQAQNFQIILVQDKKNKAPSLTSLHNAYKEARRQGLQSHVLFASKLDIDATNLFQDDKSQSQDELYFTACIDERCLKETKDLNSLLLELNA